MRIISLLVLAALVAWSCSSNNEDQTPVDYHLTVGDTAVTIPHDAVMFAVEKFSLDAYLLREYQVARDSSLPHPGATYHGTLIDWKALGWAARETFLLPPYVRNVLTSDAQHYYMIGTYLDQFGYGWRDTFDPNADLNNPIAVIWLRPADSTLRRDSTGTIGFDGESRFMEQYRAMWTLEH